MRSRQARLTPGRAPPEFAAVALGALSSLYNFAYRLVGNEADAEDLVQDTDVEALRHAGQLRHRSSCYLGPACRRQRLIGARPRSRVHAHPRKPSRSSAGGPGENPCRTAPPDTRSAQLSIRAWAVSRVLSQHRRAGAPGSSADSREEAGRGWRDMWYLRPYMESGRWGERGLFCVRR